MKKLGKTLTVMGILGAAGMGTYMYMKMNKNVVKEYMTYLDNR